MDRVLGTVGDLFVGRAMFFLYFFLVTFWACYVFLSDWLATEALVFVAAIRGLCLLVCWVVPMSALATSPP